MSAVEDRAQRLAVKHIPHFGSWYCAARANVIAAIAEGLSEAPPVDLPSGKRWTLEELKADAVREALTGTEVRIWSGEHRSYWRPQSSGYSADISHAGIYEISDAWSRTRHCGPEKRISFEPIASPKGPGQ